MRIKDKRGIRVSLDWVSGGVLALLIVPLLLGVGRMMREASEDIQASGPEARTRFQPEFPGLEDAARLSPSAKQAVVERANKTFCSCGCGYTIAACLRVDPKCPNRSKNLDTLRTMAAGTRESP